MLSSVAPLLTVLWHTLAIYAFLIGSLALLGRRQISQLTLLELVIIMILGSSVETAMVAGNTSLPAGLVSAAALLVGNRALSQALQRSRRLRRLLIGGPLLLVHDGQLIASHLRQAGLTEADVLQAIRERGYAGLADVRFAVLEVDGSVGVVPSSQPVHRHARTSTT